MLYLDELADSIKRIQSTNRRVSFQDTDALVKISCSNARCQPGHACPDDNRVIH